MTDNLHRKAQSCRSDLKFLLEIVPAEWSAAKRRVEVAIATIKNPTEQKITAAWQLAALIHEEIRKKNMDLMVTTYEQVRVERSTPTTSAPVKVEFRFHLGHDVFLAVTAEVTEERDGDGYTGHDVTILECVEENGNGEIKPYAKGCEGLLESLTEQAINEYNHAH